MPLYSASIEGDTGTVQSRRDLLMQLKRTLDTLQEALAMEDEEEPVVEAYDAVDTWLHKHPGDRT